MKPELEKEIDRKALELVQETRIEVDSAWYRKLVLTIKQYAQDTERLDWMLSHGAEIDVREMKAGVPTGWYVRWFSESKWHVAHGKTQRECIDAAIAGRWEASW
jgi:hypothetical protein